MTVYFIGAGPGAPDLVTVRGKRLIEACPVCLYAGSLVPEELVACAPKDATIMDTAPMTLDEIIGIIRQVSSDGCDVARVHSGDPSLYGAIAEQIRRLDDAGIGHEIVPGVPAFAAAAAACGIELTIPEVAQTVILTRTSMKSSDMPATEDLEILGQSGATLAIHLSVRNSRSIERKLIPLYGDSCPVIIAYRVGWHDQNIIRTNLASLHARIREHKITRTALILVGPALAAGDFRESALYDASHRHVLRPFTSPEECPPGTSRHHKSHEQMTR